MRKTASIRDEFTGEAAIRERAEREKRELLTQRNDLKWLMSAPEGRRIFMRLIRESGLTTYFDQPGSNAMVEEYAKGKAAFANHIKEQVLDECHELYVIAKDEEANGNANDGNEPDDGDDDSDEFVALGH